ncbi:YciI family protein [Phenylobacterium sp. NIBR 498073]|uniref:YciI family protein n=1 Tax=Phenylobacterium sp. NIBR 498073 TaxID=3015177 RepID=UPI0022B371FC|nr:YciI family protein [Phenylobacterium sp. NIBR 498073]WGU39541.1 YciI family protein [Phenylobacterium sp. NIBR 498073]
MRVMVLVKATADSEAGAMPSSELLEAMGRYNELLVEAGVMKGGDGCSPRPRASGWRSTATSGR